MPCGKRPVGIMVCLAGLFDKRTNTGYNVAYDCGGESYERHSFNRSGKKTDSGVVR